MHHTKKVEKWSFPDKLIKRLPILVFSYVLVHNNGIFKKRTFIIMIKKVFQTETFSCRQNDKIGEVS
jgi:hypothetical protein